MKIKERAKENFLALCEVEGYEVLGQYVNNKTKIEVVCPKGHHWSIRPKDFYYQNSRCSTCIKVNFREKFFELCKLEGYEVLSGYVNRYIEVTMICPLKHKFQLSPKNFKNAKHKCPVCYSWKLREKWEALMKCSRYTALSEYRNNFEKVLVRCNWCGNEFFSRPYRLYSDRGCPQCGGSDKETAREKFYRKLMLNDIQPLTDYINTRTKVKVIHETCGTKWAIRPNSFMYEDIGWCPLCKKNKGDDIHAKN